MATTECKLGYSCHVNDKNLKTWGTDFSANVVQTAATSSVQLISAGIRVASGTLVWGNVVLCCEHSIYNLLPESISVLLNYEFTAATAPAGMEKDHRDSKGVTQPSWTTGTLLQNVPQAKVVKELERNKEFDFAFLLIEWTNAKESEGAKLVTLPRLPDIPVPSNRFGEEVLLVGHREGEPTQAKAGMVTLLEGPNPMWADWVPGLEFTYTTLGGYTGYSGGGVFNSSGQIVGVLTSGRVKQEPKSKAMGTAFMNLGSVANRIVKKKDGQFEPASARIRAWLGGAPPLFKFENNDSIRFDIKP